MIIGDRLRETREQKKLSQGDIEKRTGLLRCYVSRVENGHTVPAIETLEKLARALEIPLYQLFYEGEEPPRLPNLLKRKSSDDIAWGRPVKKLVISTSFVACWVRRKSVIASYFSTWRRKCLIGSFAARRHDRLEKLKLEIAYATDFIFIKERFGLPAGTSLRTRKHCLATQPSPR
jgi:transcriptional regulator with XRE-family HTH domain